jgi:proline iminopeptidase
MKRFSPKRHSPDESAQTGQGDRDAVLPLDPLVHEHKRRALAVKVNSTMTTTLLRSLIAMYFGFFVLTVPGQAQQGSTTNTNRRGELPRLQDWFLSTGDWHNDPQLYVREFGDGPETIVMLHGGWGAEHSGLMDAVKDLRSNYHFVFYDQRGSLRSPSPDSLITFNRHVDDLELLREELKLDKLNIVGHSMGAILASAYAAKYPRRVKQLTLLAPALLKDPIPEEDKDLHHRSYLASQQFLKRPEVLKELDKYLLNRIDPPLSSREATGKFRIEFAARMLYDIGKWPSLTGGRALYKGNVYELTARTYPKSGWNYLQDFESGSYPVSIIVGDHDFLDFGNHILRKWLTAAPRVNLSIIENAGHMIWIDQPELFSKELLRHLERNGARARR